MLTVYWINLEESIERRNTLIKQFIKNGIHNRRIDAIKQEKGIIGCCLSHIKAIHTAWIQNCEIALICEDDIDFSQTTDIFIRLNTILETIPFDIKDNWDILQVQYTEPHFLKLLDLFIKDNLPSKIQNKLIKGNMYGTVAYLINRRGMEKILNLAIKCDSLDKTKYSLNNEFMESITHAEELLYKYVNTYFSVFPVINYRFENSLVNDSNDYYLKHEFNRLFTNNILFSLENNQYRISQKELKIQLNKWFVNSEINIPEIQQNIEDDIKYYFG